jgi:hypothetical protein
LPHQKQWLFSGTTMIVPVLSVIAVI